MNKLVVDHYEIYQFKDDKNIFWVDDVEKRRDIAYLATTLGGGIYAVFAMPTAELGVGGEVCALIWQKTVFWKGVKIE